MMPNRDWLDDTHPIWDYWVDEWQKNERRLKGGSLVLDELTPFDWEVEEGTAKYEARQAQAAYVNFPDMFLTAMGGHLLRQRPMADDDLSFGSLGLVKRKKDQADPNLAEEVFYNVDGLGVDGAQWDAFWMAAWKRAGATGHRWILVDAPTTPARNAKQQLNGLRPYLVEFSPVVVTNWNTQFGRLDWAVVRTGSRRPMVNSDGVMEGGSGERGYLLLVRQGVTDLGSDFTNGGWWMFDGDKELQSNGTWEATEGEVPLFPLYYERDTGLDAVKDEDAVPSMSRIGISELGQAAVGYMNLSSAADFDAWDAAKSMTFLSGMDAEGWNLAMEKIKGGSRYVPLKGASGGPMAPNQTVGVSDSSSRAVMAGVFDQVLTRKLTEVERLAMREATSTPDSSGVSKMAGFIESKAPKLAMFASELENAQNIAIYFLEKRAGEANPSGSVVWTRSFDLGEVTETVKDVFNIEKIAGISSTTLHKRGMSRVVKASGLATDDEELAKIESEYEQSSADAAQAKTQADALTGLFGK